MNLVSLFFLVTIEYEFPKNKNSTIIITMESSPVKIWPLKPFQTEKKFEYSVYPMQIT